MTEQPVPATGTTASIPQWDLADRMRKALRQANVSVQDIASYLDVSRSSVSNWINGRIQPSVQTMRLWALRCGVPYEWLRTGTDGGSNSWQTRSPQLRTRISRTSRRTRLTIISGLHLAHPETIDDVTPGSAA